jgi:hypothetical protein
MGWWKIKDIESGAIDFEHRAKSMKGSHLSNAIPSEDDPNTLYNGDKPADIMGAAIEKINNEYVKTWGRPVKKDELTAILNFTSQNYK